MKKISLLIIMLCTLSLSVWAQKSKPSMDSVSYSLGVLVGQNLKNQGFNKLDAGSLTNGLQDAIGGKQLAISAEQAGKIVNEYLEKASKAQSGPTIEEGKKFLAENSKKPGVVTLPSGLQYMVMKEGTGPKPKVTDRVTTHYTGTLLNGEVFDSSVERGQPATFPVNGVIKGWTEALQLMNVGSKWKLFIPYDLAYGERGAGGQIKPFATLIFEVELLEIAQ
ncbi:MAG: FKBP-type peptidyl-prolyl cis-trans isomerase [Saprospiraceae bacterium]|nr:FKBP-type peptidyl-prolyl cis-trans isomerase [Saprospiraceae bacterium]